MLVSLDEDVIEKEKSYKALSNIEAIYINQKWVSVSGKIILYFNKDTLLKNQLKYGKALLIKNNISKIYNSGNPGGFNYAAYCYQKGIHYQAFLKSNQYLVVDFEHKSLFKNFILNLRKSVLNILNSNIKSKNELAVAEALLIGYREELDRDLVKAYSNTGVVHIIAISGLHLGMIYALIIFLFKSIEKRRIVKFVKPLVIIAVLWIFTFVAGMAPSILRSAIMFTIIALGESFNKKNNIYNNLALSALIILVINPYSLWDVGFQLSYTAVLSIVMFSKSIYNWCYFKQKFLQHIWNLCSITLSAQILTLPFVLYHFHQFPVLFLITNFVAVPLSAIILYAELILLVIAFFKPLAIFVGTFVEKSLFCLNFFIKEINSFKWVVIDAIQINILQAICLFMFLLAVCYWVKSKNKYLFFTSLIALFVFCIIRSSNFIKHKKQEKVIVYNIPNHTAIDIIKGNCFSFYGDTILHNNGFLFNFHIKPSRTLNRVHIIDKELQQYPKLILNNKKTLLIIDKTLKKCSDKIYVDYVLLTKNPRLYIRDLFDKISCKKIIIDGSNPNWKVNYWRKDLDSLKFSYHYTVENGSFEF